MAFWSHLPLNFFTVLLSSDKEKVLLSNSLWRWEINIKHCCRVDILYIIIIMHDVIRTVPGSFDHLVVHLSKLLHLLARSLNYMAGRLEMELSDNQPGSGKHICFWKWSSSGMSQYVAGRAPGISGAQIKELRVNSRPQSCTVWLCSLVESDKEKREDGNIRGIRMAIQGCPRSHAGCGKQGGIRLPSVLLQRCCFSKTLLLATFSFLSHLAFLNLGMHPKALIITNTLHSQTLCWAPFWLPPSLPTSNNLDCSIPDLKNSPPRRHRRSEGLNPTVQPL